MAENKCISVQSARFILLKLFYLVCLVVSDYVNIGANAKLIVKMWRKGSSEGSDRFEYLQTLVTEFQDTDSEGGCRCFICHDSVVRVSYVSSPNHGLRG